MIQERNLKKENASDHWKQYVIEICKYEGD